MYISTIALFHNAFFSYRITAPEETTFHLLHLSLMREYIDYEFSDLKVRELDAI